MKSILPIAAVTCFMLVPAADAAPYRVFACDGPDDGPLSMRPFETFEVPEQTMNHDDHCREPYGTAVFEWPGGPFPADQAGGWQLRAPSGTSFTQLRWGGSIAGVTGSGARVELDTDRGLVAAWTTELGLDTRTFPLPSSATQLALRQVCRAASCVGPVRTTIRALTATIDDPEPPTASDFAALPTTAHGSTILTFTAADRGSGLARAVLYVDATARATALSCPSLPGDAHGFQAVQPCERATPVELAWASAGVRDGTHTISAQLEDAAGNVRTVLGPLAITTDNAPPVAGAVTVSGTRQAGETLTAAATGFDGQAVAYAYRWQRCEGECEGIGGADRARYVLTADDAGRRVRAVVTARDQGGATAVASDLSAEPAIAAAPAPSASPTPTPTPTATPAPAPAAAAVIVVAAPAPAAAPTIPLCADAALAALRPLAAPACPRVTLSRRTVRLDYGKRVELRGRVTDQRGAALAGALLDVRATPRIPGGRERREGGVGSAADGRFSYVAPAGVSRDLRIGDRTVTLLVRAAGTLLASRRGRVVTLSGRLRGGHVPRGGVLIEISAERRIVALVRTDGHGAFRARHVAARATKLRFRARARSDSSWPFVAAPLGSPVSS